ncbi:MAG TPA: hypothetical protein PLM80_00525 [Mesotoga sp.]|nr:hypothetical protein [Thermotogaceae bacterium]HPB63844.1 hypothetical protein [Mesotoga sp.]HPM94019.1 hypothetical protein [Mesotoga sp.]HPX23590.1 hypothetical protein [Mesotoga sp.]HQQ57081.1 hypothetical protein [Mesotoga sp.]
MTVNLINIFTFLMFLSRVKWPKVEILFGTATIILALPAVTIGALNLLRSANFLLWFPAILYGFWALLALVVDYLLKIEFRNPAKPSILVPFLILFYFSVGGMAAAFYRIDLYLWLISGVTSILNLYGAYYAGKQGKG